MKALVSGQAALAVVATDDGPTLLGFDSVAPPRRCGWHEVEGLLAHAADIAEVTVDSLEEARSCLGAAVKRDQALQLFLIVIDDDDHPQARELAALALVEDFDDESTMSFVSHRLHGGPLPGRRRLDAALRLTRKIAEQRRKYRLENLVQTLMRNQAPIAAVAEAWEEAVRRNEVDLEWAKALRDRIVSLGGFAMFVEAIPTGTLKSFDHWRCTEATLLRRAGSQVDGLLDTWRNLLDVGHGVGFLCGWYTRQVEQRQPVSGLDEFGDALRLRLPELSDQAPTDASLLRAQLDAGHAAVTAPHLLNLANRRDKDPELLKQVLTNIWTTRQAILRDGQSPSLPWLPLDPHCVVPPEHLRDTAAGPRALQVEDGDPVPVMPWDEPGLRLLETIEYEASRRPAERCA